MIGHCWLFTGLVVYLDVQKEDILQRLNAMKVNRILGQEKGIEMDEILTYRRQFYEKNYDIRVICEANEAVESIAAKVHEAIKRHYNYIGNYKIYPIVATFGDVKSNNPF